MEGKRKRKERNFDKKKETIRILQKETTYKGENVFLK
jgi:hypothetical protein